MQIDPRLTLAIYIGGPIILIAVVIIVIVYTRNLKIKQATLDAKGRLPISKEEGIAIATEAKKHQR